MMKGSRKTRIFEHSCVYCVLGSLKNSTLNFKITRRILMNLVDLVASKTEWTKVEAREAINAVTEAIKEIAYRDGSVRVSRLGTFYLKEVAERSGTSKLQGQEKEWTTPEHYELAYSTNNEVKSYVNTDIYPDYVKAKGLTPYEGEYLPEVEATEDEEAEEEAE